MAHIVSDVLSTAGVTGGESLPVAWLLGNSGFELGLGMLPWMPAKKGRHFVAIAAHGHGTPTAAMGARVVVEKQAARRIRAAANGRLRAFNQEFGGGTSDRCQQPVESTFPGDKL